jgi:FkbM family methyltransferase
MGAGMNETEYATANAADQKEDLIYDIGMCDGSDTAYYLFRGYRVLAVDANPKLIDQARTRFAKEIAGNRLTLLNVGIGSSAGTATFWISEGAEWSSFERSIASRDGAKHSPVSVDVVTFESLLAKYGVPHYLKIDIEGRDHVCVDGLRGTTTLPTYISVESECVGDGQTLSEEQVTEMLSRLRNIGYRRFKLVAQGTWTSVRPGYTSQLLLRLATSATRGRLRIKGLSTLAYRFTDAARLAPLGYHFAQNSSGPWGEDIPGRWMTYEEAQSAYLRERRAHFAWFKKPGYSFWYDWHAKVR